MAYMTLMSDLMHLPEFVITFGIVITCVSLAVSLTQPKEHT